MKKLYSLITLVILFTVAFKASAQDGFDQLIKSSPADATRLMSAYASPLFKGFGTGLNSGWNNTAATKKFLHFDIRITANVAMVPTSDKSFDVTKIGLSYHLQPADPSKVIAPTFGGDKIDGPKMNIRNDANTTTINSFNLPKGIISVIPAPNVQFTIGIFKNTDLTVRTTPKIKISDDAGSVGMFGFGIKHNIIQDFAGKGAVKPFDLAIAFNYNRINYTNTLNVKPDATAAPAPGTTNTDFSNQRIEAKFSGVNVQAIISKKLLFFTPFLSVGYQTASTDMGAYGNYPITSTALGSTFYTTVTDPVRINETSISGMRADVGFQMNLAIFRIYASYSAGQYQSVNGGIGFGF